MMMGRMPALVGTKAILPPYKMVKGDWIDPGLPDRMEGVLSANSAEALKVNIGDELSVTTRAGEFRVKIIGIINQAAQMPALGQRGSGPGPMRGPAMAALYVPMALAEKMSGTPGQASFMNVVLKEGVDADKFAKKWSPRLAESKPPALVANLKDVKSGMEEGLSAQNAKRQAYSATGLSLLASLFIIFTTLSMGVNERIRQLAIMLRGGHDPRTSGRSYIGREPGVGAFRLAGRIGGGLGAASDYDPRKTRIIYKRRIVGRLVHCAFRDLRVRRGAGCVDFAGLAGNAGLAAGSHVAARRSDACRTGPRPR